MTDEVERKDGNDADRLLEEGPSIIRSGARGLFGLLITGAPMDGTLQWVGVTVMNMLAAWRLSRGTVRYLPFVEDEAFRMAFRNMEEGMAELTEQVDLFARRGEMAWPRGVVVAYAHAIEEQAYELAAQVGGEGRVKPIFEARTGDGEGDNTTPGVDEMAMAYLRTKALEVAGLALSIQTELQAAADGEDGKEALSTAERVRRKRERERRGLRHMIPVSVYDGDLDLLRDFGHLRGTETTNRDAISRALEVFLAGAYLSKSSKTVPFEGRLLAQMARIKDLHSDKGDE
ncbi:hypothetical protein HPT29_028365 (plasmid) [Microvirga terrae]|uniref:DUF3800 domain-containing protein n=1 Tax=Microvirga terrae TaxID=2740529 RepID=A0ABY5S0W3_9HYPH|nr:hypothetical protein [Microvirga terrae]UVF22868.1 hypothetical protein HPT29_028365 [Microvirga terrae]